MGGKGSGKIIDEIGYTKICRRLREGPAQMSVLKTLTGLHPRSIYRYMEKMEERDGVVIAKLVRAEKFFIVKD